MCGKKERITEEIIKAERNNKEKKNKEKIFQVNHFKWITLTHSNKGTAP